MVRLVLFDVDGTLIHTGGAGREAFARVFASQFKIPNGADQIQFAGRTDRSIVREFFVRHGIEPSAGNFESFFDSYVFWLDYLMQVRPSHVLAGVRDFIRDLQALPEAPLIGLLTGNIRLGAEIKLTHLELWHLFATGGFGDDAEDRSQVAEIAVGRGETLLGKRLGGDEVLVVGDTPLDIACARDIRARVLAVATGPYGVDALQAHGPTRAVENLAGLNAAEVCA